MMRLARLIVVFYLVMERLGLTLFFSVLLNREI